MQTSFASPTGFGGALTDPPWSLSGETARMIKLSCREVPC